MRAQRDPERGSATLTKPSAGTKQPSFFRVVLLNDDFTPMDFVVHILVRFFEKNETEANRLMMKVHQSGAAVAGTYTHEIAETKAHQVQDLAKQHEYPLQCEVEEA